MTLVPRESLGLAKNMLSFDENTCNMFCVSLSQLQCFLLLTPGTLQGTIMGYWSTSHIHTEVAIPEAAFGQWPTDVGNESPVSSDSEQL